MPKVSLLPRGDEPMTGTSDPYAQVPDELKGLPQWVVWKLVERDGKPTKIPYNAQYPTRTAASDRPETWSTFDQALFTHTNEPGLKFSGIGFMFEPPGVGIDWDHCRNPDTGEIDPEVLEEIKHLNSYCEISPSGTGIHGIAKGTIPEDGRKKGNREVYTRRRFFTVTGMHLEGTPTTINESQAVIDTLWKKWFPEPSPQAPQPCGNVSTRSDDVILSRCLKTSKGKFKALFEGDTSGYSSPSEADLALCTILSMQTRDVSQIDRLFRQSCLCREKWDREDYAGRTIAKALQATIPTGEKEKKASSKVDFFTISDEIRGEMHTISVRQNLFYRENGVYIPNHGQIEARIQSILTEMGYERSLTTAKREVLSNLSDHEPYQEPPFNKHPGYVPVGNGILYIDKDKVTLHPYTDEYIFSYRLPVKYDPDADPEPVRDTLIDWVDEENVKFLIQLPAQAIIQSWGDCYKAAYLFEGEKNAAKTTYFEFLGSFIGHSNYATTPLADLLYNKYAKFDLLGKILNLADDLSEIPLKNLGEFKKLTGGMAVTVERKHCDRITTPLPCVHAFTCNAPPKCSITDDPAWWDRWVYVYFGNTFPVNPGWKRTFITDENLSGFLLLVVDAVQDIMAGNFHRMNPDMVRDTWMSASDTVSMFVHQECERKPDGMVPKDLFYDEYVRACNEVKKTPVELGMITRSLKKMGIHLTRPREGKKRFQSYKGIILKKVTNNPDHPDQKTLTVEGGQGGHTYFELKAREGKQDQKDSTCTRVYAYNSDLSLTTLTTSQTIRFIPVHVLVDLDPFVGVDGRTYSLNRGDIITLPEPNARALIDRHAAVEVLAPTSPINIPVERPVIIDREGDD